MRKEIAEVVDNFDFTWVRGYMEAMGSIWDGNSEAKEKEDAAWLLAQVIDKPNTWAKDGHFVAENYNGQLSLRFVLEESSVDLDKDSEIDERIAGLAIDMRIAGIESILLFDDGSGVCGDVEYVGCDEWKIKKYKEFDIDGLVELLGDDH